MRGIAPLTGRIPVPGLYSKFCAQSIREGVQTRRPHDRQIFRCVDLIDVPLIETIQCGSQSSLGDHAVNGSTVVEIYRCSNDVIGRSEGRR